MAKRAKKQTRAQKVEANPIAESPAAPEAVYVPQDYPRMLYRAKEYDGELRVGHPHAGHGVSRAHDAHASETQRIVQNEAEETDARADGWYRTQAEAIEAAKG